jgi:hypothetical protein
VTLEASIEGRACKLAKEQLGVLSIKLNVKGARGWPDRMFLIPGGRPFFIEFKAPGEEPDPLQVYRIGQLNSMGYTVEVHDDAVRAFRAVASALESARLSKKGCQVSVRTRGGSVIHGSWDGKNQRHVCCFKNPQG